MFKLISTTALLFFEFLKKISPFRPSIKFFDIKIPKPKPFLFLDT